MIEKLKYIKRQWPEIRKSLEDRILESNVFNLLKEKYHSLSLGWQKLIKYAFIFFVLAGIAYLPLSYFFSSSSYWSEFKSKQSLSLELLKMRSRMSLSILRYSQNELKNRVENIVKKYSTFEPQIKESKKALSSKRKFISQIDFNIQLSHLNIRQAVQLGVELNNLSQARLDSITLEENKKHPKHYDITYKLSAFVLDKRNTPKFAPKKREIEKRNKRIKRDKRNKRKRREVIPLDPNSLKSQESELKELHLKNNLLKNKNIRKQFKADSPKKERFPNKNNMGNKDLRQQLKNNRSKTKDFFQKE